jgi:hypothetical protein
MQMNQTKKFNQTYVQVTDQRDFLTIKASYPVKTRPKVLTKRGMKSKNYLTIILNCLSFSDSCQRFFNHFDFDKNLKVDKLGKLKFHRRLNLKGKEIVIRESLARYRTEQRDIKTSQNECLFSGIKKVKLGQISEKMRS